jgi:hypothetical protein
MEKFKSFYRKKIVEAKSKGEMRVKFGKDEVLVKDGKVSFNGKKVGTADYDYKHGYHPIVRLVVKGEEHDVELDKMNEIPGLVYKIMTGKKPPKVKEEEPDFMNIPPKELFKSAPESKIVELMTQPGFFKKYVQKYGDDIYDDLLQRLSSTNGASIVAYMSDDDFDALIKNLPDGWSHFKVSDAFRGGLKYREKIDDKIWDILRSKYTGHYSEVDDVRQFIGLMGPIYDRIPDKVWRKWFKDELFRNVFLSNANDYPERVDFKAVERLIKKFKLQPNQYLKRDLKGKMKNIFS